MLVLTRNLNETIVIDGSIRIKVDRLRSMLRLISCLTSSACSKTIKPASSFSGALTIRDCFASYDSNQATKQSAQGMVVNGIPHEAAN
jgi:hypothetical protein